MLIFNCSKSGAEFFTATKKGIKTSPIQLAPYKTIKESISCPLNHTKQWNWLVHAIKVKRKNILIIMDYSTRYSITLSGLKKGDGIAFLNKFEHHLNVNVNELMSLLPSTTHLIDESLDNYFRQHQSTQFHQRSDRSTQAHINDVAWHFEMTADEVGYVPQDNELIDFDQYINHMLRKHKDSKDYYYPQHEFLHYWLNQYAKLTQAQADKYILDLETQERAGFQAVHALLEPMGIPATKLNETNRNSNLDNVISLDAFKRRKS